MKAFAAARWPRLLDAAFKTHRALCGQLSRFILGFVVGLGFFFFVFLPLAESRASFPVLRRTQSFGEVGAGASWVLRCSPGSSLWGWILRGERAARGKRVLKINVKKNQQKTNKKGGGKKRREKRERKKIIRMKPTQSALRSHCNFFFLPPQLPNEADVGKQ